MKNQFRFLILTVLLSLNLAKATEINWYQAAQKPPQRGFQYHVVCAGDQRSASFKLDLKSVNLRDTNRVSELQVLSPMTSNQKPEPMDIIKQINHESQNRAYQVFFVGTNGVYKIRKTQLLQFWDRNFTSAQIVDYDNRYHNLECASKIIAP